MVITPFFAAPVLAGETMKNLQWQSRAVTMPIKGPITGWWLEYYFFYVKLRDMDQREAIEDLLLNVNYDATPLKTGVNSVPWMETAGTIPWVRMGMKRIVEEYFRDEDETWTDMVDTNEASLPLS